MPSRHITVGNITIGNDLPMVFILGPNAMESRAHALEMSAALKEIAQKLDLALIYKTSFDKANRTSISGARGLGLAASLPIFAEIRETTGLPVLTDIHAPEQCAPVAEVVDILQTPAFLCRQTDLLVAAGKTGKVVNIKKGQFVAPTYMAHAAGKIASTGNERILLCERGAMFGYNNLVVDMRGLPIMAKTGYPVVMDATHATTQPSGMGDRSGGEREFGPVLARAAAAIGVAAMFIETHQDPDKAPSDGPNMIPLKGLAPLFERLMQFDALAKAAAKRPLKFTSKTQAKA